MPEGRPHFASAEDLARHQAENLRAALGEEVWNCLEEIGRRRMKNSVTLKMSVEDTCKGLEYWLRDDVLRDPMRVSKVTFSMTDYVFIIELRGDGQEEAGDPAK